MIRSNRVLHMIRPDRVLHRIPVAQWTREEAHHHLSATFDLAASQRPDLFEPYLVRLVEEQDERSQVMIMREGLRETFATRYPNRFAKQEEQS